MLQTVKSKAAVAGLFLRKFKYVLVAVIVITAAVVGWTAFSGAKEKQWSNALDHYRRAEYDKAAEILNKLPMPKNDTEKLTAYAQTMLATRQLDKAAQGYTALYEVNKDPFNKLLLGNVYNEQKNYEQAGKTYEEIIQSNPNYVQAYVNLSTMYKMQGNNDKALEVAKKAAENNPTNTTVLELLVSMHMTDTSSQGYKDAVERLRQVNPNDPLLESINEL